MKSWSFVSRSAELTQQFGRSLGAACSAPLSILLEGDLGSGKTCLVQGIARGLDVPSGVPVNSPTYTLMNHYEGRDNVFHFDLYRLGSADELIDLDFDSYLHGDGVVIVEWAAIVSRDGVSGLSVQLDYGETEDERVFRFSALGLEGEKLLAALSEEWKEA